MSRGSSSWQNAAATSLAIRSSSTLASGPAFGRSETREKDIVLQVDVLDQILSELRNAHVERLP